MKNIKFVQILSVVALLTFSVFSCSNNEYHFEYEAHPQTELGKKLVANSSLVASIHKDSAYVLAEGVTATEIHYLSDKGLSQHAFFFEVDLTNPALSIEVATPNGDPHKFAMQEMSEQATYANREGHRVLGGVNADFYNMKNGVPRGILYHKGEAIKESIQGVTGRPSGFFVITKDKKALVGDMSQYDELKSKYEFEEAVGASNILVNKGEVLPQLDESIHPRTCIGISKDSTTIYIMAIDGRNFHYSNGMTLEELGRALQAIGADQATNLDGGGSTTFIIPAAEENKFQVRNWPTDNGGIERKVANGLVIISNK